MTRVQLLLMRQTPSVHRSHLMPDLPSTPPPEALEQVAAAWERARRLDEAGWRLELRPGRWRCRWRGELRDPRGALVRRLCPSEILALACGEPGCVG